MRFITMDEFLMGRTTLAALSPELQGNANITVPQANLLLSHFGEYRGCNSGYRSIADQQRINPSAMHSKHLSCQAVDLEDKDRRLTHFCLNNLALLETLGLWMEFNESTPTWVHVQILPPASGHRVFIP